MLLVEVILAQKEYSVKEWNSTYEDMPNRLIKVLVPDKSDYATVSGTALGAGFARFLPQHGPDATASLGGSSGTG